MKHTTTTTKKTAKQQPIAPVYVTLTQEERRAVIADILAHVHTCKQANENFSRLADSYGKDVAKDILASVRESVKARVTAVSADAKSVRARLCDGAKVAKNAWDGLLADESVQGRAWARAVYESAGCDLLEMLFRYASFVTADGLIARRSTRKDATTGERESGYVMLASSDSVSAWMSALKTAVKNAKKSALGASRSEYQRTVTLTWELE